MQGHHMPHYDDKGPEPKDLKKTLNACKPKGNGTHFHAMCKSSALLLFHQRQRCGGSTCNRSRLLFTTNGNTATTITQ